MLDVTTFKKNWQHLSFWLRGKLRRVLFNTSRSHIFANSLSSKHFHLPFVLSSLPSLSISCTLWKIHYLVFGMYDCHPTSWLPSLAYISIRNTSEIFPRHKKRNMSEKCENIELHTKCMGGGRGKNHCTDTNIRNGYEGHWWNFSRDFFMAGGGVKVYCRDFIKVSPHLWYPC